MQEVYDRKPICTTKAMMAVRRQLDGGFHPDVSGKRMAAHIPRCRRTVDRVGSASEPTLLVYPAKWSASQICAKYGSPTRLTGNIPRLIFEMFF